MEQSALLSLLLQPHFMSWMPPMPSASNPPLKRTQSTPAPRPGDPTEIQKRDINDEGFGAGGI